MNMSNRRPTQDAVGDITMESGDWRAQLQRQRIVNKIMDTLKTHLPFSEYERLQELKKIAERVEEEIYTAATSQIKTMKDIYLYGDEWQEEVYQKIKAMKDLYLQVLNNMHQKIVSKMQQHDSLPQQPKNEQLEKLKVFKNMLERFMQFLQIPKHGILANYKDKLGTYERQIINVINSNRRKPAPSQQQAQALLPPQMQSLQQSQQTLSQLTQRDMQRLAIAGGFQKHNVIDMQKQLCPQKRAMPETSSASLDLTAQTSNPNGGDWQEEVYQKIKAMKDLYLLDLDYMHQKIVSKLSQHDSLPQQPKNEQLEKLKVFKNMLERYMQFLQIPKHGILANYKDKLGTYEKQIINVINSNRRKPAPPQQQAQA